MSSRAEAMASSSSAGAARRSPLVVVVALLATAVAGFALLLLVRTRTTGRPPVVRASAGMTTAPSPGAVGARGGAGRGVPRLVGPTDHTAAQRAELAEVDHLARARAAETVGLTAVEAQKAAGVYQAADRRRDQLEAEIDDGDISKPSAHYPSRLWRHEARVLADMEAALGQARAHALRAAEAAAYVEQIRQAESRPGRTFPISQRHARRRSSAMLYLEATIEAAHDGEQTTEGESTAVSDH